MAIVQPTRSCPLSAPLSVGGIHLGFIDKSKDGQPVIMSLLKITLGPGSEMAVCLKLAGFLRVFYKKWPRSWLPRSAPLKPAQLPIEYHMLVFPQKRFCAAGCSAAPDGQALGCRRAGCPKAPPSEAGAQADWPLAGRYSQAALALYQCPVVFLKERLSRKPVPSSVCGNLS